MSKGKVLIVDDDAAMREFITEALSRAGFVSDQAGRAAEGLAKFRQDPGDVVIADVRIPDMDGLELARRLKAVDPDTTVILITGFADIDSARAAVRLGVADYLPKPFPIASLLAAVEQGMAAAKRRREQREYMKNIEALAAERTQDLEFQSAALKMEQERFYGIFKNANFGLLLLNAEDDKIVLLNTMAKSYLSLRGDRLTNFFDEDYRRCFPEAVADRIGEVVSRVKATHKVCRLDAFTNADGRIIEMQAYPVLTEGVLRCTVVVTHDITERKELEQQLLMSSKLAGIGELAAGIAHEINNPIGFVMSNTGTLHDYVKQLTGLIEVYRQLRTALIEGRDTNELVAFVGRLEREIDIDFILNDLRQLVTENRDGLARVAKIIKNLRDFSHVDEESPSQVNVNTVLEEALNLVRNELKYKAKVTKDLAVLPPITAFANQLVQVFINILINAAHAIEHHGTIHVCTFQKDDTIYAQISDNGCGIAPETLPKIFDPFFTTKPKGRGTGLGLSIAMEIVQKHRGTITVESTPGEGATFAVGLPVAVSPAQHPVEQVQASE